MNRGRLPYTFRRARHNTPRIRLADRAPLSLRVTIRIALFWIAAACCVVAELAILKSLLFGRAARAARRDGLPAVTPNRAIEITWAILPAVGLLLVLYLTWRAVDAPLTPLADANRAGVVTGV